MQSSKILNTKPSQFEMLVNYMTNHRDLSKGYLKSPAARQKSHQMWTNLSQNLNAEGPPQRDIKGWKKVWSDFKNTTKGKLRSNKANLSGTGGGPSKQKPLSPLETKVAELLDLVQAVEGLTGITSYGVTNNSTEPNSTEPINVQNSEVLDSGDDQDMLNEFVVADIENQMQSENDVFSASIPQPKNLTKKQQTTLLERQVEQQIDYQKNSKEIMSNINENLMGILKYTKRQNETSEKVYRLKKEKLELKKQKFEFKKKSHLENTKTRVAKLELKREILKMRQEIKGIF